MFSSRLVCFASGVLACPRKSLCSLSMHPLDAFYKLLWLSRGPHVFMLISHCSSLL